MQVLKSQKFSEVLFLATFNPHFSSCKILFRVAQRITAASFEHITSYPCFDVDDLALARLSQNISALTRLVRLNRILVSDILFIAISINSTGLHHNCHQFAIRWSFFHT